MNTEKQKTEDRGQRTEIEAVKKLRADLEFSQSQGANVAVITDQQTVGICLIEIETLDTCYSGAFRRGCVLTEEMEAAIKFFSAGIDSFNESNPFEAEIKNSILAVLRRMQNAVDGGIWWCNTHQRQATAKRPDGRYVCDPKDFGISASKCDCEWQPAKNQNEQKN